MVTFLTENFSTIVIFAALLLAVALIIRKLYRDKKEGKSCCGCGGGCSGCAGCRGGNSKHLK